MTVRTSLCALGLALVASACALPRGSNGRPVAPAGEGTSLVGGGVMIPFAAAGGGAFGSGSGFDADTVTESFVIPSGSFDYALGDRHYIGVDLSIWSDALSSSDDLSGLLGVFVNPRWEYAVAENFSLTVDGNLGFLRIDEDSEGASLPFIAPTFGIRAYIPTGFGGPVISQQIGTAFVTVTLPGSLAYDVPIPVGEQATLHVFPEVRWDPTVLFIGDGAGVLALFSGGLSLMLAL